jgi:A/G-specific adenine glycosylase
VPSDVDVLEALPGVGPYTARAVAAIAFGVPAGAVDTNVRRVLGRLVAGDADALGRPAMQRLADAAVPVDRPGDWTHAVMDVGATICRPARPACGGCPVRAWCIYRARAADGGGAEGRPPERHARRPTPAFPTTARWLRGRIIDRLRSAPDGVWVALEDPIGSHDAVAVGKAARALAGEGLVELDGSAPTLTGRLPTT